MDTACYFRSSVLFVNEVRIDRSTHTAQDVLQIIYIYNLIYIYICNLIYIIMCMYIYIYAPEKCPRTLGTKVMVMRTQLAEKLSCRRSKHITRKCLKTSVDWCANVFVLMPLHYVTIHTKIGAFDG
jgi:hypothetical protein